MATTIANIEATVRQRLIESSPTFWSSDELRDIIILGIKDLWRDIADLKAEHFLKVDNQNVSVAANNDVLLGVPTDVHKIYLIEPRDTSSTSTTRSLFFRPRDFNSDEFAAARSAGAIDSPYGEVYYAMTGAGGPIGAVTVRIAPKLTGNVNLSFSYVPTLEPMVLESEIPIPGEADAALVAYGVAFARAKEREDRAPDPAWLTVYSTEKQHLLNSLGVRQYQEPVVTQLLYGEFW